MAAGRQRANRGDLNKLPDGEPEFCFRINPPTDETAGGFCDE
nr:MAG TPA: hypothetical protein [Bacteriophage sp.]